MRPLLALSLSTLLLAGSACNKDDDKPATASFEVKQESYELPGTQLFPRALPTTPTRAISTWAAPPTATWCR